MLKDVALVAKRENKKEACVTLQASFQQVDTRRLPVKRDLAQSWIDARLKREAGDPVPSLVSSCDIGWPTSSPSACKAGRREYEYE